MNASISQPAFLFGAGASIPAGFASTCQLTERVLRGDGVVRHTDETYYLGEECSLPYPYVSVSARVLAAIKARVDHTLKEARGSKANYEDLIYMLRQISDFESGEVENPVVGPFLQGLTPSLELLLVELNGRIDTVGGLAREAEHYVRDVVWRLLDRPAGDSSHIGVITSILHDASGQAIIATLNHDTHLEKFIRAQGFELEDGFGPEVGGVRYWQPLRPEPTGHAVAYFKLHGSVDWYWLRPNGGTWYDDRVGMPAGDDIWHTRSPDGPLQTPLSGRPLMVMGTFNKYLDYSSSLFATVHSDWRRAIDRAHRLAVCGYSFSDKGINAQIIDWIYGRRGRRILVIDPDITGLRTRARGAIGTKWDAWISEGILRTHESGLEHLQPGELADFFIA